ncbi:hypothetical protein LTR09_006612 [Extremus antarcticus]|uniref:NmrA-like domain-containing protein n=1 Tax=Extremus antarcticus TaxID=702011 RepID=A0AAJ0GBN0_9PEZI|nr:hypothetical protein LTR09_006612 [Extremus antarcticus]
MRTVAGTAALYTRHATSYMAVRPKDVSDGKDLQVPYDAPSSDMSMMRIAIAGTGGLARIIAHYIDQDTSHHVIFLSRSAKQQLTTKGYQVTVVDYDDADSLKYALRGIDTVISTVTGAPQVELIKAAVSVRVRRFAPAEFEGLPQLRPANDPLDRHRSLALHWLNHYSQFVQSTRFVCGILYERFQPGGLAQSIMGLSSGFSGEGDYIMNCRTMEAQVPAYDAENNSDVAICMTAAQDVGRFVTKAIDLKQWPAELRMCGQRILVKDLVATVSRLKGQVFDPIVWHNPASLRSELQLAAAQQDTARGTRVQVLIATANGRYDFSQPNLNRAFPDTKPITFQDWFVAKWSGQQ